MCQLTIWGDGSACQSDRCCVKSSEWPEDTPDPMEEKPQQHEEPLDEVTINMADAANQKWMETVKDLQDFEVKHLTFVIPMKTRHATGDHQGIGGDSCKALSFESATGEIAHRQSQRVCVETTAGMDKSSRHLAHNFGRRRGSGKQ